MHLKRIILTLYLIVCIGGATNLVESSTEGSTIPFIIATTTEISNDSFPTFSSSTPLLTTLPTSTLISTTIASSTTIFSTPTPTSKPNPPTPKPTTNWVVVDEETNITCIVVKLTATFSIPFSTVDGQIENATLSLPGNATANGSCHMDNMEDDYQAISLQWVVDVGKMDFSNMLTLVFRRNSSSGLDKMVENKQHFYLSHIRLQVYPDSLNFPNCSKDSYIHGNHLDVNLHPVEVNNSYRCNSEESIQLDFDGITNRGVLRFAHVQMEAFRTLINDEFSAAVDCAADKVITSDIVPIAVGCALAALVVIVLVAYLIGRRRARQRGYQSV